MTIGALVLAAGAGTRFGGPKALARSADGRPWLTTVATLLGDAGLPVTAVLSAATPEAVELLPDGAAGVFAPRETEGLSASLREGILTFARRADVDAVLITAVDQPDLPRTAVDRILSTDIDERVLRRAVYNGRPGHPVLIGRAHWSALLLTLHGDRGAGDYLRAHGATEVECADLWSGADIDTRPVTPERSSGDQL